MFNTPIILNNREINLYLKGKIEGKKFYIRRLDPTNDKHFIEQWKIDLQKDVQWRQQWVKGLRYNFCLGLVFSVNYRSDFFLNGKRSAT